jgi:hypothetical protein
MVVYGAGMWRERIVPATLWRFLAVSGLAGRGGRDCRLVVLEKARQERLGTLGMDFRNVCPSYGSMFEPESGFP